MNSRLSISSIYNIKSSLVFISLVSDSAPRGRAKKQVEFVPFLCSGLCIPFQFDALQIRSCIIPEALVESHSMILSCILIPFTWVDNGERTELTENLML